MMTEKIYGLPGVGMPGEDGARGRNGFTMTKSPSTGTYTLSDGGVSFDVNNDFSIRTDSCALTSLSYNVYTEEGQTVTKYMINYGVDFRRMDDLRIDAYIFYHDGDTWTASGVSNPDRVVTIKEWDDTNTSSRKTDIVYDEQSGNKIKKIILIGYVREYQTQYRQIFIGAKKF